MKLKNISLRTSIGIFVSVFTAAFLSLFSGTSYGANYNANTTLSSAISSTSSTSVSVNSATGFPSSGNYVVVIDSEQVLVTSGQGTTSWTVTRGYNGTTAATHSLGAYVYTATATTTITSVVSSVVSISSSGSVNLNVIPTSSGSQTIATDTVQVSTNDTAGYTLLVASSSGSSSSLASGANTIPASSGTQAVPVVQAANTWGYCVTSIGGFDGTCPSSSASNQAISGTYKFAGIPLSGAPNTIKTTAATATNDSTTVWYAVAANTNQPAGTYTGTVTYTAIAN